MFRRIGALACLGCAVVLTSGAAASAAPMSTTPLQSATIPVTQTDWGPSTTSLAGVDPVSFTKFNPRLGTLESVHLSLSYTYNHDVSMTFTNASTITVNGMSNLLTLERPDKSTLANVPVSDYNVSQTYGGPTFPHALTLPTHTTTGSSTPITLTSASDLALFSQSAPADTLIKLPITAQARSSFASSTGNGSGGAQVFAGVVATLSYSYEPAPVPEPSALAAFGLGIGGYLFARRNPRRAR